MYTNLSNATDIANLDFLKKCNHFNAIEIQDQIIGEYKSGVRIFADNSVQVPIDWNVKGTCISTSTNENRSSLLHEITVTVSFYDQRSLKRLDYQIQFKNGAYSDQTIRHGYQRSYSTGWRKTEKLK